MSEVMIRTFYDKRRGIYEIIFPNGSKISLTKEEFEEFNKVNDKELK